MTETLKDKLRRIMNLAERGSAGERENAAAILQGLLDKYGITIEDLASEEECWHWFETGRDKYRRKLLCQLYAALANRTDVRFKKGRTMIGFLCTNTFAIELQRQFDFYAAQMKKEFEKQRDIFYSAFIRSNDLYPDSPDNTSQRELSPEEIERLLAVISMSRKIQRTPYHKALTCHEQL